MERKSSLWPIDVALAAAVEGDEEMTELLSEFDGKPAIFSGRAPRGASYPRIVMGDSNEDSRATFGKGGNEVAAMLDLWSNIPGRQNILAIYEALIRLLDGQVLQIEGQEVYRGRVRLVTILPDPVEPLMHGVVEFSALTGVIS